MNTHPETAYRLAVDEIATRHAKADAWRLARQFNNGMTMRSRLVAVAKGRRNSARTASANLTCFVPDPKQVKSEEQTVACA